MVVSNGPTAELCHWLCSTGYEELPAEVRKEAVTLLLDQVAASEARKHLQLNPERWVGLQPRPLQDWFVPVVYEPYRKSR